MKKFNPNGSFTLDDVRNYKSELDKQEAVDVSKIIAQYVKAIDSEFITSVNMQDSVVRFSPRAQLKIELKYYDELKKIYESRGFRVDQSKVEIGREYVNMGDFYDTEFINYDYYIIVSLPCGWEHK